MDKRANTSTFFLVLGAIIFLAGVFLEVKKINSGNTNPFNVGLALIILGILFFVIASNTK